MVEFTMTALLRRVLPRHALSVTLSTECCVFWLLSLKYAAPKVYQCAALRYFLWRFLGAVYFHLLDFRDAVMFATSSSGTGIVVIHCDILCGLMTAYVPTGKSLCLRSVAGKSCHLLCCMPLLKVDPGVSLKFVDLNIRTFGAPLVLVDGCLQGYYHGLPCGVRDAYMRGVVFHILKAISVNRRSNLSWHYRLPGSWWLGFTEVEVVNRLQAFLRGGASSFTFTDPIYVSAEGSVVNILSTVLDIFQNCFPSCRGDMNFGCRLLSGPIVVDLVVVVCCVIP